jgi:hypothetical protein
MRALAAWLLTLGALAASPASADPIGPSCGTCQGAIYTLEYDGAPISVDIPNGTETFRITLTIDTSGYNGGGINLNAVAIKVSSMLVGMSLFDAPGGAGNWTTWMGGLNANGCSQSGSGFECAYAGYYDVPVPNATPYTWVFDLEMDTGALFTTPFSSTIKVRYVDAQGEKVGDLVSEGITLQVIPEPASAALVAVGLLGLALAGRHLR